MRTPHLACLVLLIGCAAASAAPIGITQYLHTSFGPAQGAPEKIALIAQTSDGFLWLGTGTGLYRFDGVRFERIEAVDGVPLLSEIITALEAPRSGGLWIGYQSGGASFLDSDGLRNYSPQDHGLPPATIFTFAIDPDGIVWAGTHLGLMRFDGKRWTDVTQSLGLPFTDAFAVMTDKSGDLWLNLGGNKIAVLRRGSARVQVYSLSTLSKFRQDSDGRIWIHVHHPNCLYFLDSNSEDIPPCHGLPAIYDDLWLTDRAGDLWVAAEGGVTVLPIPSADGDLAVRPDRLSRPDPQLLFFSDRAEPISAFQDREGNIWFGTTLGLEQLRVSRLIRHGPYEEIVVLGAGNQNSLWVATTRHSPGSPGDDFFQLKEGVMVPHRGGPTQITASYRDTTGVLWMGGYGRVWKLNDSTWEELAAPPRELGPQDLLHRTQAIARDAKGDLWLSVLWVGLFRLRDGKWELITVPGFPAREFPITIYSDAGGSIWLGYSRGRLARLSHDTWHIYTDRDGLNVGTVQALARISGELWIGGERGLQRIHNDRFESVPGLTELRAVKGILRAKNGDLWLTTSLGGVHVTGSELRRFDSSPGAALAYETLTTLDGMPGVAAAIRPLPTVLETDDGRIWFEADDRFSSFDPDEHNKSTAAAHVIIGAITDDGRRREPTRVLTLFPNVRNVAIDYTATSASIPSRVRFKYRLENFDQIWQDVGTRRVAYYNNLPPGRYVFRVVATNDDKWSSQGAAISLIVPALFYQTVAFRIGVIALGILAFSALFYIRLRQVTERQRKSLERRMEDRLNERTRIARELHDSLLQGFHGFMFRLEAVRQLLPERSDAAERLNSAMQLGDQAINEGREAVQNLRSSGFDERDLPSSLGALGAELSVGLPLGSKPEYRVVVEGTPRELSVDVRDNAYRTVREAVRNAYQHARARHIETDISFADSDLCIRVRDDGVGMDAQILSQGRRAGHWGLPGMRERTESIGGAFHVWSKSEAGTEIELRIPARVAYAQAPATAISRLKALIHRRH